MRRLIGLSLPFALLSIALLSIQGCSACSAGPTPTGDSGPAPVDAPAIVDSGPESLDDCYDGLDNDRDGTVDEECSCDPGESQRCFHGEPELAGIGACAWGMQDCSSDFEFSGWDVCRGDGSPSDEICDGVDNDCDGVVDEGCTCITDEERSCYFGPDGTADIGTCRSGVELCLETAGGSGWGACAGWEGPGTELCDGAGADEDCDGTVDEDCACTLGATQPCFGGSADTRGIGVCSDGTQECVEGAGGVARWGDCIGETVAGTEACSGGLDEDCDGFVDCADSECGSFCCSPYSETLSVVPAEGELMFVVDRSGSMDFPAQDTAATRWQELLDAMTTVLPDFSGLHMGLLTFPLMDGTVESLNCDVASTPDIGIAMGTESSILSRLVAADPRAGDTPTPEAFVTTRSYLSGVSSPRERFVILATDGLPEPNCGASVSATVTAIASLRTSLGIDTFVLGIVGPDRDGDTSGIPALQAGLNQMADAGGRARAGSIRYYEANDGPALTSSLRAIVAAATDCRFTLSAAPARPSRVVVRQDSAIVSSGDYTLSGRSLEFTGTACTRIQSGLVSSITVADTCL